MEIEKNANFFSQAKKLVDAFISSESFDRQLRPDDAMGDNTKEQIAYQALDRLAEKAGFDAEGSQNTVQDFFNALVTDETQDELKKNSYSSPVVALNNFIITRYAAEMGG